MNHMAQLRHDYPQFQALNTEILVMVPNGPRMIQKHIDEFQPPYPILTDKGAKVARQYFQTKQFFLVGTPTIFVVDRSSTIRYAHYASSVMEEPTSDEPLAVLAKLAG